MLTHIRFKLLPDGGTKLAYEIVAPAASMTLLESTSAYSEDKTPKYGVMVVPMTYYEISKAEYVRLSNVLAGSRGTDHAL